MPSQEGQDIVSWHRTSSPKSGSKRVKAKCHGQEGQDMVSQHATISCKNENPRPKEGHSQKSEAKTGCPGSPYNNNN